MAGRLHRDTIDNAHRANREDAICPKRLAAQPAARKAKAAIHIGRLDDPEVATRAIGPCRQITVAIDRQPSDEGRDREPLRANR